MQLFWYFWGGRDHSLQALYWGNSCSIQRGWNIEIEPEKAGCKTGSSSERLVFDFHARTSHGMRDLTTRPSSRKSIPLRPLIRSLHLQKFEIHVI